MGVFQKLRKTLVVSTKAISVGFVFTASLGAGAVLHLDARPIRALVRAVGNRVLADTLTGEVRVERVDHLGLDGVRGVTARVFDDTKTEVLFVRDIDVTFDLEALLVSLRRGGSIAIKVRSVRIGAVDALLDVDEQKTLRIERAFTPKPSPPSSKALEATNPTVVKIELDAFVLAHAWVHGNLVPGLDADIDALSAHGTLATDGALAVTLDAIGVTARGPRAAGSAPPIVISGHGDMTLPIGVRETTERLNVDLSVKAGAASLVLSAHVDGEKLAAELDVPALTPEAVKALVPGFEPTQALALHATLSGTRDDVNVSVAGSAGKGRGDLKAKLRKTDLGRALSAQAHVVDVDVRAFDASAPSSNLAVEASVEGERTTAGELRGVYRVVGSPGVIDGQIVPAFTAEGRSDGARVSGDLLADEAGARVKARYAIAPLDASAKITFDAEAAVPDLARIARVKVPVTGTAYVSAKGVADLGRRSIDAAVVARGSHLRADAATVERVEASALVQGGFLNPVIVAHVRASGLSAGEQTMDVVTADARVAPTAGGVRIDGVSVAALRGTEHASVTVARIDAGKGSLSVRDARVSGLGDDITFGIERNAQDVHLVAKASGVSLARVAALLGTEEGGVPQGVATLDVDVRASPRGNSGHASLALRDVVLGDATAKSELRAVFVDRGVRAAGTLEVGGVGRITLDESVVTIPGSAVDPKAWAHALFDVGFRGDVDIEKASRALPEGWLKGASVRGGLAFRGRIGRQEPLVRPHARVVLETHGFELDSGEQRLRGTEAEVVLDAEAESGEVGVAISAWDGSGELLHTSARTVVSVPALLAEPARLAGALRTLPFALCAGVPARELNRVPMAGLSGYQGTVSMTANASGTMEAPNVVMAMSVEDLALRAPDASTRAVEATLVEEAAIAAIAKEQSSRRENRNQRHDLDANLTATYDGHVARLRSTVFQAGAERARLEAEATAKLGELLELGGDAPWTARTKVTTHGLDLARLPFLPRGTRGVLDATAEVNDLHGTPSAEVHAKVVKATFERVSFPEVSLDAKLSGKEGLVAEARVKQDGGGASIRVSSAVDFDGGLVPTPRIDRGLTVQYDVERFRLSVLKPVVRKSIPEIDGELSGKGRLTIDETRREIEGTLALVNGFFYVPKLGEEIRDVGLLLRVDPKGTITVDKLAGKIGAGRFDVKASAVVLPGAKLRAVANLVVTKDYPLPISVDGVYMGALETRTSVRLDASPAGVGVDVSVPELRFELPNQSAQSLQELDDAPFVAVGRRVESGALLAVPARRVAPVAEEKKGALPVRIRLALGDNVYITRESELRVGVSGNLDVRAKAPVAIDGKLTLREGFLEVQDKRFTIERGTVTWDEKNAVDNPTVVATASYVSDGAEYHVYADYAGTVKAGRLKLRAEPTLKENQILALLLFGEPYGQVGGRSGAGASAGSNNQAGDLATSYGTGVATHGLNRAIRDLASIDVVTKVTKDERTQAARPEVGVRVKNNLVLAVEVVTGTVPPSEERSFFKIDWRFLRHLSLVAKKGTRYSTIFDLIYQYRY